MSRTLQELLVGMLPDPSVIDDFIVKGLSLDSREAAAGDVFFLMAKNTEQRKDYLQQAIEKAVSVVLYDAENPLTKHEQSLLIAAELSAYPVKQLGLKISEIAARFYGHPSLALTVIAVTGTNGKTSVTQFIAQALESRGLACGIIGTLGAGRLNDLQETGLTTPDPISIQRILTGFYDQKIEYAVIEASSHGLLQGRLDSVAVDIAVLTNLSQDHLDYHETMANYGKAKARLFEMSNIKTAVINSADSFGQQVIDSLITRASVNVSSFSRFANSSKRKATFQADNTQLTSDGVSFDVTYEDEKLNVATPLFGEFNVDNLLATIACLVTLQLDFNQALRAISECRSVKGRMEMLGGDTQATVVIDFAHTPDALSQALVSLRKHVGSQSRLFCVFGCGGNRDTSKRALMGAAVEKYADKYVITDDNPRNEDPENIVDDILSGIEEKNNSIIEHDRRAAITLAVRMAKKGDIVLIAGKGHENYQDVKGIKVPFDDKEVVKDILMTDLNLLNEATV